MSRLLTALLLAALISAGCTAAASAQSAYPVKNESDSGVVAADEYDPSGYVSWGGMGNLYVRGMDACTYMAPDDGMQLSYQQYDVGNCVPIQTPWIRMAPWTTKGWAIYCPSYAPNSWINSDGGGLQQWTSDSDVEAMNELESDNSYGPSPVAKSDYYTTNWGTSHHFWLFTVGCSPQAWNNVGDGGNYCCGQGTSAVPDFSDTAIASAAATRTKPRVALMVKGPARERRTLKPGHYVDARELDLRPSSRQRISLQCRRGYRLHKARHGIGYYTANPPTDHDGVVVDRLARAGTRGASLTLETDARAKRGVVRAQFQITCARPGVA